MNKMFACEVTAVETILLYFSMMYPHNQCKNIMLQIYLNLNSVTCRHLVFVLPSKFLYQMDALLDTE